MSDEVCETHAFGSEIRLSGSLVDPWAELTCEVCQCVIIAQIKTKEVIGFGEGDE